MVLPMVFGDDECEYDNGDDDVDENMYGEGNDDSDDNDRCGIGGEIDVMVIW